MRKDLSNNEKTSITFPKRLMKSPENSIELTKNEKFVHLRLSGKIKEKLIYAHVAAYYSDV